jgi:hypothetical protein
MGGQRYEYHRVGYDHRPLVFRGDGTFDAGADGCERYGTIRDGRLLIMGDGGRLTMALAPTEDGGWEGAWLVHERMAISLSITENKARGSTLKLKKLGYVSAESPCNVRLPSLLAARATQSHCRFAH